MVSRLRPPGRDPDEFWETIDARRPGLVGFDLESERDMDIEGESWALIEAEGETGGG
jgi:hypothetical protein